MNTTTSDLGNFQKYEIKRKRGIDDLPSIYAFHGSSQGDESRSNEISDYVASKGWMYNVFTGIDITDQQAIYEERDRRIKANEDYVAKLHAQGKFGEEYTTTLNIQHNAAFDTPSTLNTSPIESYKIVFLDFTDKNTL